MGLRPRFWPLRIAITTGMVAAAWLSSGAILRPASPTAHRGTRPANGDQTLNAPSALAGPRHGLPQIRADLFGAPAAPAAAAQDRARPQAPPPLPAAPLDPLAGYALAGIASIGGRQCALVEDRNTHEGQYLRVGDRLGGYLVRGFDTQGLRLECGGDTRTLPMNADYSLVPLSRNAGDTSPLPHPGGAPGTGGTQAGLGMAAPWAGPPAGAPPMPSFDAPATQPPGPLTGSSFGDAMAAPPGAGTAPVAP